MVSKMSKKQIDKEIEKAFPIVFNRVQISLMRIPELYQDARLLIENTKLTPIEALKCLVTKYQIGGS